MIKSRYILTVFLITCFLSLNSCEPVADDCVPLPIADFVIGSWNVNDEMVRFNTDGSYVDDNNILVKTNIDPALITVKTYAIQDSNIDISVATDTGLSTLTSYKILSTDCEIFEIEWISGTTKFTLTR